MRAEGLGQSRTWLSLALLRHATVVLEDDDVAPAAYSQSYAAALRKRGIDVSVDVVPGLGHNILFAAPVLKAVEDVLRKLPAP